jgi:hypothetical protein
MLRRLRHFVRHTLLRPFLPSLPANGFPPGPPALHLDGLSDRDLDHLNRLLPWNAFTVDGKGRRFGNRAWSGKRAEPQVIPDPRIARLDQEFGIGDKSVLEIGCFEGIHTIGLARAARQVTAIDARVDNVVKTLVRASFYGCRPTVFVCNVEDHPVPVFDLRSDVVHHVGVLYQADRSYVSGPKTFRYREFRESGAVDPFSGMYPHSKWLLLEDIVGLLKEGGFETVTVAEEREERNGPRVLLFAHKPGGSAR